MITKKHSTQFPGVRYRLHKSRKYNRKLDRYFSIRYRANGKLKEEGIGWASEGWNATKASLILADLKKNQLTGKGPQTLAEQRELENEKREAEKAEKERKARDEVSFGNYFNKSYFTEAKSNKKRDSWRREKNLIELWIDPVIGKMPFKDIRPFHLERIKKNMADAKKAPRSIQYALAVVRQVFNHAIRNGIYAGQNPARIVSKPKFDNKRMRFLTKEEADILLANIKTRSHQLHNIALLSLHCGLRAGEIFDLKWSCIDFKQENIAVMDTKGGKNRTVYMTQEVINMLSKMDKGKPTDLVFANRKGVRITEVSNAFGRAVNDLKLNEGITDRRMKVSFHTLRHTYASWLVQNGVDLYTVKELIGHSTLAMTERYAHLAPQTLKNAVKKLENSLKQKPKIKKMRSIPENA